MFVFEEVRLVGGLEGKLCSADRAFLSGACADRRRPRTALTFSRMVLHDVGRRAGSHTQILSNFTALRRGDK